MKNTALEPYLARIREGVLLRKDIRADIFEGKCMPVFGERRKLIGAEYPDGRRFDLVGNIFYTPEALAALLQVSYAMSSEER